jgi:AraC family transcriptional regulator
LQNSRTVDDPVKPPSKIGLRNQTGQEARVIGNKVNTDTQSASHARKGHIRFSGETAASQKLLPVDAASIDAIMSGRFRLEHAPTLAAPSLSDNPIAFTRLRCDNVEHGLAGPVPPEGSFAFQVMLKPVESWELRTNRGHGSLPPSQPGDTFLFDLSENPQLQLHSSFDMVRFYMPRSALDSLAYGRGLRRVAGLRAPPFGVQDPIMHGMAMAMVASMKNIDTAQPIFVEYMALAFHAHVVQTYGSVPELHSSNRGLAPWQMKRIVQAVEANPGANHSISMLAQECRLSSSYFARAFKETTGLAPHQWLTRKRIEHARRLLAQTSLELSEIALACGFVDQSHFSRVFAHQEKRSPGKWRRLAL